MMPRRHPRLATFLAFSLALLSSLPEIKWCRLAWADVQPECFASCATPGPCTAAVPGEGSSCDRAPGPGASGTCASACSAGDPARSLPPADCGPAAASDRAWFPGDVPGGSAPPEPGWTTPTLVPVDLVAPAIEPEPGAPRWIGAACDRIPPPTGPPRRSRPPVRAPPKG